MSSLTALIYSRLVLKSHENEMLEVEVCSGWLDGNAVRQLRPVVSGFHPWG